MATFRDDLIHLLKEDEVLRNKVKVYEKVKERYVLPFIFVRLDSLAEHSLVYRLELFSGLSTDTNPDDSSIELIPHILQIIQFSNFPGLVLDGQAFIGQQILGSIQYDGFIIRVMSTEELI